MTVDLNNITARIKQAGSTRVRAVPMLGEDVATGKYQIEINDGSWQVIATGLSKSAANLMIKEGIAQANRLILG